MADLLLLAVVFFVIALAVRSIGGQLAAMFSPAPGDEPPEPLDPQEADSGAFLHRVLMDAYGFEREPWALERVASVSERLQAGRPEPHRVVILWIPECTAFTAPGPFVYLSRRLLERCRSEDAVALAVAHEIAHHDLGHLDGAGGWMWLLDRLVTSPEMEADADAHGFNLCLAAGYDPRACLTLFDVLEESSLDWGDLGGVFGSESEIAAALADRPDWEVALARWRHTRRRGYAPLRERRSVLWDAYQRAASAV